MQAPPTDDISPGNVYVIVSSTAVTEPLWPPRGYAGPSGRMDVIARSFLMVDPPSKAYAILLGPPSPPKIIYYDPLFCNISSERQVMFEIAKALLGKGRCIRLQDYSIDNLFFELNKKHGIIILSEDGEKKPPTPGKAFILGAHLDPPQDIMRIAGYYSKEKIAIGPKSYHTSHVIAYLEWARRMC